MKNILIAVILLLPLNLWAQELNSKKFNTTENSTFECLYSYTISGKNYNGEEFKDLYNVILQAGAKVSKFWDYGAYLADSVEFFAESDQIEVDAYRKRLRMQINYYDSEIFTNFPSGQITENGIIGLDYYKYSEPKENIEWTLASDTTTVLSQKCYKATLNYGGRIWTAWYAPSIPSSYGPWKLSGLPGLVLRAEDNSGMFAFEAISIRAVELPIFEDVSLQRNKIKAAKFHKAKVIHEYNPYNFDIERVQEVMVYSKQNGGGILYDGILVREYANGYNSLEVVTLKESEIPELVRTK